MRLKQKPEDFSVKESYRFDPVPSGRFRVYLMDKQKLSTFDAIRQIREKFGLKPDAISFCGLKDKQGRTEQIIAIDSEDIDFQQPDLRLKYLGRTDQPLSARNTTSNRFSVTVRALTEQQIAKLPIAAAEVNRLGVVNYFDSQRFGAIKHGQGFIAKDLIRGDFEAALRNYLAKPSPLDRTDDARLKDYWSKHWGKWTKTPPFKSTKYDRVMRSLKEKPEDFVRAFLQIEANYRAMILFEYQSYLWNEGVRRLLQLQLSREELFPMPYQAGTLLFHKDANVETLRWLRHATFPLLAPDSQIEDARIREAVEWVLGKEHLKLADLRIEEARRLLFFKHEERPILVYPEKLVVGRTQEDELNQGYLKANVAFTLPPGSYATLVIKRLFHYAYKEETEEEITPHYRELVSDDEARERKGAPPRPSSYTDAREPDDERPARRPVRNADRPGRVVKQEDRPPRREARTERAGARDVPAPGPFQRAAMEREAALESPTPERAAPRGFRANQKARKEAKAAARVQNEKARSASPKKK